MIFSKILYPNYCLNPKQDGMRKCLKICLYIPFNYRIFDRLGQFYTMTNIGDIIRLKRIEMGISQKDLASQIGVDVSFLCKIEKNEKNINLNNLLKINKILQLNNDDLKVIFYSDKIKKILSNESGLIKYKVLEFLQKN